MLSTFEPQSRWLTPLEKLQGKTLMEHLFSRMNGMYPNRWKANFPDLDSIDDWEQAWSEAFDDEGITPNDIGQGIRSCRTLYSWPPSLTEFLAACRPYLQPSTAFHEAVRGLQARAQGETFVFSHPAIFFAALAVGQHDMRNGAYASMQARWDQALADQLAKREWPEIPEPPKALAAPVVSPAQASEAREKVKKTIAGAFNVSGKDPKQWARNLLATPEKGTPATLRMAREALGLEA